MKNVVIFLLMIASLTSLTKTEEDPITIHVVPHTHDDAGWIWTFEDYYEGTGGANVRVHSILDNMVLSLNDRPDRTFIYVEMAFFIRWYRVQEDQAKDKVKDLLKQGRFEFINGGYVMHDEAASYYQHSIDQMRLGLQFLKEEFNFTPEIAWFIDPFGHSASNAFVLSKMGFTKIAFVRIDYQEKNIRRAQKTLEFFWVPFNQVDSNVKIFTHITYDHYCPPPGMSGFISDKEIDFSQDDLVKKSNKIYADLKIWNSGFRHKNVLLMYGCDFTFNARGNNFKNVERVMDYINSNNKDMKLVYSTPTRYFKTIFEQVQDWPEYKNQDFFPYADHPYSYWTGYLTSRPFLKGLVRETGNYLTTNSRFVMEQLLKNSHSSLVSEALRKQFFLRENLAICQHHDAVTGTAKELVSEDYELRLNASIDKIKTNFNDILKDMVPELKDKDLRVCISSPNSNINCQEVLSFNKNANKVHLGILNPGLNGSYPINIDLNNVKGVDVRDESGALITSDFFCIDDETYKDDFNCKLRFFYNFDKSKAVSSVTLIILPQSKLKNKFDIKEGLNEIVNTNLLTVHFDLKNLKVVTNFKHDNQTYNFEILHAFYNSYNGQNSKLKPNNSNPDGAYVFSPVEELPIIFKVDYNRSFVYPGELSTIILLRFEHSYLIVNIVKNPYMIEVESIWDPIIDKSKPKNFLLLINSDIENNVTLPDGQSQPEFWTDSNGMKMMRRLKDFRQGWKYEVTDKVSGNFYPVNSMISIRDRKYYTYSENDYEGLNSNDRILTVYNDRTQSGGVMAKGQIMLLLHRFSERDDWKGLEEPLYEISSASKYFHTRHIMTLSNKIDQNYFENLMQNKPALFSLPEITSPISIESNLSKLITHSPNIVLNFHIKSEYEVFVQAFNMYDYYHYTSSIKPSEETLKFNMIDGISYFVTEYKFNSLEPLTAYNDKFLSKHYHENFESDATFAVKTQDFRLFLLKFNWGGNKNSFKTPKNTKKHQKTRKDSKKHQKTPNNSK